MAVKTFSVGETLTASDTNTYLANAGLVYVASGTFSAVTYFEVTGFSSSYERYRVVAKIKKSATNASNGIDMNLYSGATARATAYYGASFYMDYLGGTGSVGARNNGAQMYGGNAGNTTADLSIFMDCQGMTNDRFTCTGNRYDSFNSRNEVFGYQHDVTETNDRIRFAAPANITGQWALYGYRTA